MKVETKVGLLFALSIILVALLAYYMGALNPFSKAYELNIMYNFAGGIEVGSPVRVMGIKVGKVKSIDFAPDMKTEQGEEVKLLVRIGVERKAWPTIRSDSKYFINLAGVIGEKFLEITPGSLASGELTPGDFVRGEDPPRIDQLISQGYGLAGKILEVVEKNEGSVTSLIKQLDGLVLNFNKTLTLLDKTTKNKDTSKFINNMIQISDDLAFFTASLRKEDSQKTFELLKRLIGRLESLDGPAIRKFLQEEGIRAKMF